MQILLACDTYYPAIDGVAVVMRQVAERLAERGHHVTVATTYIPTRGSRMLNGVAIAEFRVAGNLARGITGESERYRRYVLDANYDVFMVKAAQQWTLDALLPVLDRMKKPKVFIPCGFSGLYDPAYADYFRQMPGVLRQFDRLIFYASDYRDINFAREHGLTRVTILPNGASEREFNVPRDTHFRARHGIPEDAFVILTVGGLTGLKGHRELADAFNLADFAGRRAVMILNGNKPPQGRYAGISHLRYLYRHGGMRWLVKSLAKHTLLRLGCGRLLGLLGYSVGPASDLDKLVAHINGSSPDKRAMVVDLPRPELIQAYFNSNLFVFASNIEYSPLVLYEAAAAGLPFLSVPVGNAEEIAQWTGGGVICPAPRDEAGYTRVEPAVLAKHMVEIAGDPGRLRALGGAGRKNWSEQFTWAKITDRYEALFGRLISGG